MPPLPSLLTRIRSYLARHDVNVQSRLHQRSLKAAYYRGGTSRAVIIQPHHLPKDRAQWPSIFRQIMGSGDPYGRQLDGMGAGISSLSKICLVEPSSKRIGNLKESLHFRRGHEGVDPARAMTQTTQTRGETIGGVVDRAVDIDYTFVELGIENDEVDVAGNCGNMSSAIGPYAYNARLLPSKIYTEAEGSRQMTVRIRNTNTGKVIDSTFDTVDGEAAVVGDYTVDGVSGPGSRIKLDFLKPYGSKTGKVLPTDRAVNTIADYEVSCVDGANPAVFIRADDIGVDGTILPNDFNKLPDKLALLEQIRKTAAVAMGISSTEDQVPRTVPKIGLVSRSSTHSVLSGQTLDTSQIDIVIRFISDEQPHRAIPLTAALTTAVAARIPGTIVEQMLAARSVSAGTITIGHVSGRIEVNATMDKQDKTVPASATVYRTARRLFEGETFWIEKDVNTDDSNAVYHSNGSHSLGLAFVLESRGQGSSHLFRDDSIQVQHQQAGKWDILGTRPEDENQSEQAPSPDDQIKTKDGLQKNDGPRSNTRRPAEPLTVALRQIQGLITEMLDDPDFQDRKYPKHLLLAIKNSSNGIITHSNDENPIMLVDNLSRLAKNLCEYDKKKTKQIRKEELDLERRLKNKEKRKYLEREESERRLQGPRKRTRAYLGLDKDGILIGEPTYHDVRSERKRKRMNEAANARTDFGFRERW